MTIRAFYKGVEFDITKTPTKEIAQAELLYLNSLGDPVFYKGDNWRIPENNIENVDINEVAYWFLRLCELDTYEQGEEFYINDYGLEVFQ